MVLAQIDDAAYGIHDAGPGSRRIDLDPEPIRGSVDMKFGHTAESHGRGARLLMRRYELIGGPPDCELLPGTTDPRKCRSRDPPQDEEYDERLYQREPAPFLSLHLMA